MSDTGPDSFGAHSLGAVPGLEDFLVVHPAHLARWRAPLPLYSRTALLRGLDCPEGVVRAVEAAWRAWR